MTLIKLSLHNHTNKSDGLYSPEALLKILAREYDVVAITDHNYYTRPKKIPKDLLYIRGVEFAFHQMGMEVVGLDFGTKPPFLQYAEVGWVCHPRFLHCPLSQMAKYIVSTKNVYGHEIYNQGMEQLSERQLDEIDHYKFNHYAVDDMHVLYNLKTSWMEMEVDSVDKHTVLENLKSGDFWNVCKGQ